MGQHCWHFRVTIQFQVHAAPVCVKMHLALCCAFSMGAHGFCLGPAGACRGSTVLGWQERCAPLCTLCVSCSKVPPAFPRETAMVSVTNPTCQALSVQGFGVHRQKLLVYLILIPCLNSRQRLCACVYLLLYARSHPCTLGSLHIELEKYACLKYAVNI